MSKKICFLFGAGAEAKNQFGLPTGAEFMAASFLDDSLKESLYKPLKDYLFNRTYFGNKYEYSRHSYSAEQTFKSIFKKWIFCKCQSKEIYERYKAEIKAILNKEEFCELLTDIDRDRYDGKENKGNRETEYNSILAANEDNLLNDFKTMFKCLSLEGKDEEQDDYSGQILELFVENNKIKSSMPTGIAHILDSHFHTIIDPFKYGKVNFSKVLNYYWSIFFSVYQPILKLRKASSQGYKFKYKEAVQSLVGDVKDLYDKWNNLEGVPEGTYYHLIKEELGNDICGILTTNYFNFAEKIIGKCTAYLNGQLKFFEIPETLEVIDITKQSLPDDKIYFPFIFGQSYTKPVVSHFQIKAFSSMKKILDEASMLVILGYNINEDDNHINAYLRDFVCSKHTGFQKKIIVVTNNEEVTPHLKLKLANAKHIKKCVVDYAEGPLAIIKKVKEEVQVLLGSK